MTQKSYFWDGTEGDASLQPIDSAEFSEVIGAVFCYDRTIECVIDTALSPYSGRLVPSNPAGTTLRIAPGTALVDGRLYESDANIDFDCSVAGNYRIVLRRSLAAQTVRMVSLFNASGLPTITQTAATWDVIIAGAVSTGAALTVTDERVFIPANISSGFRQGYYPEDFSATAYREESYWAAPGLANYKEGDVRIIVGSTAPTGTRTRIYFGGERFKTRPIILFQIYSTQTTVGYTFVPGVVAVSADDEDGQYFEIGIDNITNVEAILWMAIGTLFDYSEIA